MNLTRTIIHDPLKFWGTSFGLGIIATGIGSIVTVWIPVTIPGWPGVARFIGGLGTILIAIALLWLTWRAEP